MNKKEQTKFTISQFILQLMFRVRIKLFYFVLHQLAYFFRSLRPKTIILAKSVRYLFWVLSIQAVQDENTAPTKVQVESYQFPFGWRDIDFVF